MAAPDWGTLFHAYGAADDLPELLDELTPDPSAPAWEELWGRVCHQGTTYSASPHVLPPLLHLAQAWEGAARTMPLTLAGAIVASAEFNIAGFEGNVRDLGELARETASAQDLSRSERVYIMSSMLAFGGDADWGDELTRLNDEEFIGRCPSCDLSLYLTIGDGGCFATNGEPAQSGVPREEIMPCEGDALEGLRAWLYRTALDAGDEELARRLCCVFGRSRCPGCNAGFEVAKAIERLWQP